MASYSNTNQPPKNENRSKWMIGCGVGAIIILCVVMFLVVGGLVGIQKFLGNESAGLNVEVLPPPSPPLEGDDFSISVTLSNVGTRNITISEVHLPNELSGLAVIKEVLPPDKLVQKDDNANHYVLNFLIAPNGQQTIDFFFEATQAGEISGNVTVYVGEKSTTSTVEIDILPKLSSIDDSDDQLPVSPVEDYDLEGQVILFEEFNDDTDNWEVGEFDGATVEISSGQMVVDVFTDNLWGYSIMLDNLYDSVNLVVDIEVIKPVQDGNFGFMCGFQDEGNFTALEIKPDGYYSIWAFNQNRYRVLVDWTFSEVITSRSVYSIGAYCGPDRLALSVDDVVLVETIPLDYHVGKVGLIAGTYFDYPFTVGFDNFTVMRP